MKKDAFHLNKAANLSKNWGPPLAQHMDHRSGGMKKVAFHLNKAANLSKNWGPPLALTSLSVNKLMNNSVVSAVNSELSDLPVPKHPPARSTLVAGG